MCESACGSINDMLVFRLLLVTMGLKSPASARSLSAIRSNATHRLYHDMLDITKQSYGAQYKSLQTSDFFAGAGASDRDVQVLDKALFATVKQKCQVELSTSHSS